MSLTAHIRVAEEIGDHRAEYYARKFAGDLDMDFWGPSIAANVINLVEQVKKSDKHLQIKRTPRPNKEKWEQALAGHGVVEVCVR